MKPLPSDVNWNSFWTDKDLNKIKRPSWSKKRMMKILAKYTSFDLRVLDAGSCKTYSLDYSIDALNLTRKMTSGRSKAYLQEDLLNPEFGEKYKGQFDLIFSDGLFEHFVQKDQCKIIDNFIKLKSKNGIIVTFVPNLLTWWTIVRPYLMPGIEETPFILESLKGLHSELEIIESGGINVLPLSTSPDSLLGAKLGMLLYCIGK
jgi:hypothetical protein